MLSVVNVWDSLQLEFIQTMFVTGSPFGRIQGIRAQKFAFSGGQVDAGG